MLSGFQRYFCMQYTTLRPDPMTPPLLCYQDFKDTFVCNTQRKKDDCPARDSCVIRISKILLYAIHNISMSATSRMRVVLSGFQRYFCMQYTTFNDNKECQAMLCYQDFKDTFVCNTQRGMADAYEEQVVLSGFQRYFCMQYTTL